MNEENIFFQIDKYLIQNCKDKDFFAKRFLPMIQADKFIILNHFGTLEHYKTVLNNLKNNGKNDNEIFEWIQWRINKRPGKAKFSIHNTSKLISDLDTSVDSAGTWFRDYLFNLIRQKNLTEVEVYKKAKLDRRLFSKIRKNKFYIPSRQTILAIAIAMQLDLEETNSLLEKAGYFLSKGRKEDVIIEYFIENKIYDLFLINEVLEHYDCQTLGS